MTGPKTETKEAFLERTEKEESKISPLWIPHITYRRMADIQAEKIKWLWPGRIPRAKTTLIAGDPGLGKSQLSISLGAIASTGGRWPVDRTSSPLGNVVILSAEDDAADTIRPRLDAAGADVSRIFIIDAVKESDSAERPVSLDKDIQRIGTMIQKVGDVVLVIIDPISAYLGGTDSHKNSDMRRLLAPLAKLAADVEAAILCISHLNKSSGTNALGRVMGSLAFVAAVRAAYIVTKDPDDETRRLFLPAKNNLGPDGSGLAYNIEPVTNSDGIETSRISWCSESVTMTADDVLAIAPADDGSGGERADAAEWLREILRDGPMPTKEVKSRAKDAGFAVRTVERAKHDAGITSRREGSGRDLRYLWELTDSVLANHPPSQIVGEHGEHGEHADTRGLQRTEEETKSPARQPSETGGHGEKEAF